ncbi:DUF6278 family protein [Streptomyces sp. NPDC005438]|uniref:DUF6278 family protein n=1 Tax=Streptomyces sp. NPDC005438 TaxID=3156880 RepID=UPI0033B2F6D5
MNISIRDIWRKRHVQGEGDVHPGEALHPERAAELYAECELLRARAEEAGVVLADDPESLSALDQLLPSWRDDPELLDWLGNDAGLYLGTVLVRTVPGAGWELLPEGHPVVRLASGRRVDVVAAGVNWADTGSPELSQVYAETSEG